MNEIITLLPLITVFIIFYVILYIPQRRRQKKHKEYVENLKIGDNVITDSGIFGRVVNIKEEKVTSNFAFATVVSIDDIKRGQRFSSKNIWVKRPGVGEIKARDYKNIIGKIANRDIKKDKHLKNRDIR